MSDTIGNITVPALVSSGLTFPLTSDQNYGFTQDRPVIVHRFGILDAKQEQRYAAGIGPRKFAFRRQHLSNPNRNALASFWEGLQGAWQSFTYNVPNADQTTTATTVTWEYVPLSIQYLTNACQVGFNFIEVPTATLSYPVTSAPAVRFPSSAMSTALLSEVQQIIPLVHIRVRDNTVPDIWLSDRRVTLTDSASGAVESAMGWASGSQLYLARLVGIGEPGSDVLLSQDIKGSSDNVRFTFGNGDRVMTALANSTDLKYASIDLCLFHVNSGSILQLWKGVIQSYTSDGTANFPVTCSDGFFQIMNQYPERQVSRQCWKTYNDGINCPFATKGSLQIGVSGAGVPFAADPNSCDYYLESANGCQAHGMTQYFGGQQADPQGVTIKDDSTGFLGLGRNTVTATSIISDTVWGLALPEIWCNSGGNALYAFMANALMVDYRDESTFADSIGILGAGPLGGFTPSQVVVNADGYPYVVAPMVDGFTWQGFSVNGNMQVTKNQPGMGLRQVQGNDPANPSTDYFSLGQGTPQVWEPNNYAAGVAFCEMRVVKPSSIQPSTPDQHQMTVPIDYGLSGWVWDANGNRSAVLGLTNPFWIAVNMLLRALGICGPVPAPLQLSSIPVTLPPSSFFNFQGSTIGVFQALSYIGNPVGLVGQLVALIGSAFTGNAFSVPMSNAANQAEVILQQNLSNWQNLPAVDQTTANQATFVANFNTIWNAYVTACNTIAGPNPTGNAEKALLASVNDRERGGKFDWFAGYLDPIANSATPGDTMTTQDLSAQQLATFVLSSLVNNNAWTDSNGTQYPGDGCAQIAAAQVTPILGTGTETQFQFQGALTSQKPFRDWLTEVLNCCLGYYTWEFGKLKLGCRINASATDTYTLANMLFQSLKLTPIQAAFEHLVISYADVAYQYQANTAEYCDKTHAAYYGRAGSPLTSQMHSVGLSTLSQALRIAATRTREEVGGVNATEWAAARVASWGTTLLGLANEVGQVVSITHPDVPGGTGDFRIQRLTLNKDWSVQFVGQTVTQSMYDLDDGPKPMDVTPAPLPGLFYAIPLGPAWAPYQIQAASNDALFPGEWTFDIDETYNNLAQGVLAALTVTGKLPLNEFSATGAGAPVIGMISQSSTGGSLPACETLRVSICAIDSNGLPSIPSKITLIGTSASGTDTFTLNNVAWPAVAGLASYVLFVSAQDDLICAQATGTLTPTGNGTTYSPASITFGGPLARSTWALPSPYVAKVRVKGKLGRHFGVLGASVESVATNTIVSSDLIDTSSTPFNATGRVLSVVGRQAGSTPYASFNITAHVPATGTLTLDRDPTGIVEPGDAFVIRCQDSNLVGDAVTQVTDAGYQNSLNDYNGLTAGAEVGNLIRVIAGTGRGQPPSQITANTATQLTFQPPLTMDGTSVWIVETPTWTFQADSTSGPNATLTPTQMSLQVQNYIDQPLVLAGFTVDINGNESPDGDAPIRESWVFGQPPFVTQVNTATTLAPEPQTCEADATNGAFTVTLPPFADWIGDDITIVKVDSTANAVTWQTSSSSDVVTGIGTSGTLTTEGQAITITATQA